jgi:phosphoribosyl 1,2-cyclic phosphodiesterase
MALSFCVLASGSAGNCTLVTLEDVDRPRRHVLIDAGLAPRTTARRLERLGVSITDVEAIFLTHADCDHVCRAWIGVAADLGITWRMHRRHVGRAVALGLHAAAIKPCDGPVDLGPATSVSFVLLPHDDLGSSGFIIEHAGRRLGYATDFGRVTPAFAEHFRCLDALAIESNYDRHMQVRSARPSFLKRRIMGGLGHLSNEQALEAVLAVDASSSLQHLALLHLSRECNRPELPRGMVARRAPHLLRRLTISRQDRPTPLLSIERPATGRQLPLFALSA